MYKEFNIPFELEWVKIDGHFFSLRASMPNTIMVAGSLDLNPLVIL